MKEMMIDVPDLYYNDIINICKLRNIKYYDRDDYDNYTRAKQDEAVKKARDEQKEQYKESLNYAINRAQSQVRSQLQDAINRLEELDELAREKLFDTSDVFTIIKRNLYNVDNVNLVISNYTNNMKLEMYDEFIFNYKTYILINTCPMRAIEMDSECKTILRVKEFEKEDQEKINKLNYKKTGRKLKFDIKISEEK